MLAGSCRNPASPRIATSRQFIRRPCLGSCRRVFIRSLHLSLIDRSNEQVYIPDDGSFEFRIRVDTYGFEARTVPSGESLYLTLNGGLTQIMNSFYQRNELHGFTSIARRIPSPMPVA